MNYERSNFSVAQNLWVENAPQHILPIASINSTTPAVTTSQKSSGISIGAIVGIVVGVVVLLLLAAAAAFFVIRGRRKKIKEAGKSEVEEDDPFRKAEMDGNGKPPIGELYAEGKAGEVDSSSKVEMQGSQPGASAVDKKNMAEIEGSRGGVEMEGTVGGMEMEGSRLRAEMAGDHLAPVELDAGSHGLSELPSPNTSNSEFQSPLSSSSNRRTGLSARWSRRQKPIPKQPDSESSDISADDRNGARSGRMPGRTPRSLTSNGISSPSPDSRGRQPSLPSPNSNPSFSYDSGHLQSSSLSQRNPGLEVPSRSLTPMEVSSQSSGSRERQRTRGHLPERQVESVSSQPSPVGLSSPSNTTSRRADSAENWNRGQENRERSSTPRSPEAWSPVSPSDRSPANESWEMVDRRRPSPLGNASRSGTPRSTQERPREGSPLPPGNFF